MVYPTMIFTKRQTAQNEGVTTPPQPNAQGIKTAKKVGEAFQTFRDQCASPSMQQMKSHWVNEVDFTKNWSRKAIYRANVKEVGTYSKIIKTLEESKKKGTSVFSDDNFKWLNTYRHVVLHPETKKCMRSEMRYYLGHATRALLDEYIQRKGQENVTHDDLIEFFDKMSKAPKYVMQDAAKSTWGETIREMTTLVSDPFCKLFKVFAAQFKTIAQVFEGKVNIWRV